MQGPQASMTVATPITLAITTHKPHQPFTLTHPPSLNNVHYSTNYTMTTSVASKRLFQEYKHLTQDPPDGITAGPVEEDDLFVWEALIEGPEGTPYEGGIFPAELKFPKDYPLMPPTMKFLSDIWHPNGMCCAQLHCMAKKRLLTRG